MACRLALGAAAAGGTCPFARGMRAPTAPPSTGMRPRLKERSPRVAAGNPFPRVIDTDGDLVAGPSTGVLTCPDTSSTDRGMGGPQRGEAGGRPFDMGCGARLGWQSPSARLFEAQVLSRHRRLSGPRGLMLPSAVSWGFSSGCAAAAPWVGGHPPPGAPVCARKPVVALRDPALWESVGYWLLAINNPGRTRGHARAPVSAPRGVTGCG